jgi:hypothetical protein
MTNAHKGLARKNLRKRPIGRHRLDDNIKMDLKEIA